MTWLGSQSREILKFFFTEDILSECWRICVAGDGQSAAETDLLLLLLLLGRCKRYGDGLDSN